MKLKAGQFGVAKRSTINKSNVYIFYWINFIAFFEQYLFQVFNHKKKEISRNNNALINPQFIRSPNRTMAPQNELYIHAKISLYYLCLYEMSNYLNHFTADILVIWLFDFGAFKAIISTVSSKHWCVRTVLTMMGDHDLFI